MHFNTFNLSYHPYCLQCIDVVCWLLFSFSGVSFLSTEHESGVGSDFSRGNILDVHNNIISAPLFLIPNRIPTVLSIVNLKKNAISSAIISSRQYLTASNKLTERGWNLHISKFEMSSKSNYFTNFWKSVMVKYKHDLCQKKKMFEYIELVNICR